jgi:hypothetical protein
MTGETLHKLGADGVRRAKLWLEATTRAQVPWINPEPNAVPKLEFAWADSGTFSFDMGGFLVGGQLDTQEFLAECKLYKSAQDQGTLYKEYLAKCFRVWQTRPDRGQNFMWITWAPFAANDWDKLCSSERVALSAKDFATKLGISDGQDVTETCNEVAQRLWILVLSEKQELHLTMTKEHEAVVRAHMVNPGGIA